jgi:hypothetical protein
MTKINSKWIAGIENPEEFESKMIEQKELFKRLYELLEQKERANDKDKLRKNNYDSPNWGMRQADSIGYGRCLQEMKALLNYTQE